MSAPQLEACAARMPEPERTHFLEAQSRANALIAEAAEIRRYAWRLYRDCLQAGGLAQLARREGR